MTVDAKMLRRTTSEAIRRLRVVRATVGRAGAGEVLVSRRTKIPGEKGRALHGKAIANMLADRGHDPFAYPQTVLDRSAATVAQGTAQAIQAAWVTGRPQHEALKTLFLGVATTQARWARTHLLSGGLGAVTEKTAIAKRRAAARGRAAAAYINTFGVRSKRFVQGIRSRYRRMTRRPT